MFKGIGKIEMPWDTKLVKQGMMIIGQNASVNARNGLRWCRILCILMMLPKINLLLMHMIKRIPIKPRQKRNPLSSLSRTFQMQLQKMMNKKHLKMKLVLQATLLLWRKLARSRRLLKITLLAIPCQPRKYRRYKKLSWKSRLKHKASWKNKNKNFKGNCLIGYLECLSV